MRILRSLLTVFLWSFVFAEDGLKAVEVPTRPYYAESAMPAARMARIVAEAPVALARARAHLESVGCEIARTLSAGTFQHERACYRLLAARNLCDFATHQLARGDRSSLGFVACALADLRQFKDYFADEFAAWKDYPLNPVLKPVVLDVRDFGACGDGHTSDSAAFARAVAAVRALGGRPSLLRIPAGTYYLDQRQRVDGNPREDGHFAFTYITNCVVTGESPETTSLVFGLYDVNGVVCPYSRNSTLRNLNLYYAENPFFQGTALEKNMDPAEGWIIASHDPGTLKPNDPRFLKTGEKVCSQFTTDGKQIVLANIFFTGKCDDLGDGRYKIYFNTSDPAFRKRWCDVKLGCKFIMPDRDNRLETVKARAAHLFNFENVWIRNSRAGAFTVAGGFMITGWKCRVFPRSPDLKLSTNADSFFNSRGTHLSHCDFHNMNDDGVNCLSTGRMIAALRDGGRTLIHRPMGGLRRPGDLMQVIRPGTGEVVALLDVASSGYVKYGGETWSTTTFTEPVPAAVRSLEGLGLPELSPAQFYDITHGRAKNNNLPDFLYAPQAYGPGFVCVGNRFGALRNIGIQIQCPNAIIASNTVYNISGGIHASCLMQWIEGPPPYNVEVRGNDVRDVSTGFCTSFGSPSTTPPVTTPFRGLHLVDNRFTDVDQMALQFVNAEDVLVEGNVFTRCARIRRERSRNVVFRNNTRDGKPLAEDSP